MTAGNTGTAVGAALPEGARCRKCGYLLRGLPEAVCPECGSAFDPAKPKTYALTTPEQRRRKLYVRCAAIVALALLIWAAAPRGTIMSSITLGCSRCGQYVSVRRNELIAPRWFPWRYPGWSTSLMWWTDASGPPLYITCTDFSPTTQPAKCGHTWDFLGMLSPRSGAMWVTSASGTAVGVNGRRATPENLAQLLRQAVDPRSLKRPVPAPNCPPDPASNP